MILPHTELVHLFSLGRSPKFQDFGHVFPKSREVSVLAKTKHLKICRNGLPNLTPDINCCFFVGGL